MRASIFPHTFAASPEPARPAPHPIQPRASAPLLPSLGLLALGPLTRQLSILAQADLQEYEAGGSHAPDADQHECDDLPERPAENRRTDGAQDHQRSGRAKGQNP